MPSNILEKPCIKTNVAMQVTVLWTASSPIAPVSQGLGCRKWAQIFLSPCLHVLVSKKEMLSRKAATSLKKEAHKKFLKACRFGLPHHDCYTWYLPFMSNGESRSSTCLQTSHWDCKGDTVHEAHQVHDNFYNENLVLHSGIHWYFLILVSGDWVIKHWHSRRCFSRQITEKIPRPQVYREMNRVWCPRLDLFRQMSMVMKLWQLTGVARSLMNFGYPSRN